MPEETTAFDHYELLISEGHDPVRDSVPLREYMSRWDGPLFYGMLEPIRGSVILEVGVGTGRVAKEVIERGCSKLTGIDLSPSTIARARENLSSYPNVELVVADAESYTGPQSFDCAYSVLTFMHIKDKRHALANMVTSLKPGGRLVLSLSNDGEWLDFGTRKIRLFPASVDDCICWLEELGCCVDKPIALIEGNEETAVLVKAVKR